MKISINRDDISCIFWSKVGRSMLRDFQLQSDALTRAAREADSLRPFAAYNTGSVSIATMLLIAEIAKLSAPRVVAEVGTFIGNTTTALGHGLQRALECSVDESERFIFSCDYSNDIKLPWGLRPVLVQFPLTKSVDMFNELERRDISVDLFLIDGRLSGKDLDLVSSLASNDAVILLDDFVGIEKGVVNAQLLLGQNRFAGHTLIYPPKSNDVPYLDLVGCSLAILVPQSTFMFTRQ